LFRKLVGSLIANIIEKCCVILTKIFKLFLNYRRNKMSEQVINKKERKEFTPDMAFMGFLMAAAAISGIYFLPSLIIMVVSIVS
jgi:hypothetical protein